MPEGTLIVVPTLLLHTEKKIWGDPDVFRPERCVCVHVVCVCECNLL